MTSAANKRDYLCMYDYGAGGVWAIVSASAPDEIVRKFPLLRVFDERPSWMNEAEYLQIERFDLNDRPPEWLRLTNESGA
jgi:hypothetical protein